MMQLCFKKKYYIHFTKVAFSTTERRGSVVVSTSACHAGGRGSIPGPGALLGLKTWLSTLQIVYLCVFRLRH